MPIHAPHVAYLVEKISMFITYFIQLIFSKKKGIPIMLTILIYVPILI
jgi:hypothetical protein